MFLQTDGSNAGDGKSIKGAFEEFKGQFKGLSDQLAQFDVQAKKVVGDTFGQGADFANKIRISVAEAVKETANLGYTTSDYASMLVQISSSLQRNVDLSSEQLENFMLFADAAGLTAEQIGKLVVGFEDIGIGAQGALKELDNMSDNARRYGINVSQYMDVISENLSLMNKYKFKDGVDGLSNMVAKSQALRININTVTQLAEKFLDPAGAIDAAASLQMMGGAFAGLADPFQLMNMAQNDIDALFDSITEAAGASASFNEETGQFELSALEMRRLRGIAKELGIEYDQLAKGSVNFAARQEKLSQLEFFDFKLNENLDEDDKEFLASVGQLDTSGELKFAVKRGEETKLISATELTKDEIDKLRKQQADSNKTDKTIALEQRDILTNLYNLANETGIKVTAESAGALANDDAFKNFSNNLQEVGESFLEVTDTIIDSDFLQSANKSLMKSIKTGVDGTLTILNSGLTTLFDKFFKVEALDVGNDLVSMPGYGDRVLSGPEGSIALNNEDTVIAGTDLFGGSEERNTDQIMANLPRDIGNVLQNNLSNAESPSISFEDLQITHSGSIRLEGDGRFLTLDMLANNPQMLENLTNMIKQRMSSQTMGYSNA